MSKKKEENVLDDSDILNAQREFNEKIDKLIQEVIDKIENND